jgi:CPA1 family monovalent cation:H+ antiporter
MELEPVDLFAILLALAVVIGCINYFWVKLPPAIGMLLGSLLMASLYVGSDHLFHLHAMHWLRDTLDAADLPHLFLDGTVALLLFAASLHVDIAELNRRRRLILLLATASVVVSTAVFGYGIFFSFGLVGIAVPLAWCLVLGAVLAPTDAIVVENLLERSGLLPPPLRAAIVGESLFNDGAGVVLFLLALGITKGDVIHFGHGRVVGALVREIAGGAVLGVVAGWGASFLMQRIKDQGLQLLISLVLVLGCYRIATLAGLSGPIAVVTAGLCLSPSSRFAMPPDTRAALIGFWLPLNQILNIMLFLLMGLQILELIVRPVDLLPIIFAIPLAVIARFVSVALPLVLTRETMAERLRAATVLTWAGLRGGISIALALTLPASPWRTDLLVVTYAVVIFTIVVQGLTFARGLRMAYAPEPASEGVNA